MIEVNEYIRPAWVHKIDPKKWDVSVDMKVEINQVGEYINEMIARHQINEVIDNSEPIVDPAVW